MGARHSHAAPSSTPAPSPAVSHFTAGDSRTEGDISAGVASLGGAPPPCGFIDDWLRGFDCTAEPVPEAETVSNGKAEGLLWDLSVGDCSWQGGDMSVHYVSAMTLNTPRGSGEERVRKMMGRESCCCCLRPPRD